jgi:uncharacterized membrane protein YjjP (DUF1212 family)
MSDTTLSEKVNLILNFGSALHRYGTNAPRIEAALTNIASSLGLEGNFFSTPTYLSLSIYDDEEQVTRNIRIQPGSVNLDKLTQLDELAIKICDENLDVKFAREKLKSIVSESNDHPKMLILTAFSIASLGLAIIFRGSYTDISLSAVLGAIVGALSIISSQSSKLGDVFEFLAAISCTLTAYIINQFIPFNFEVVVLASLIVIIPGLGVTVALTELATKNLVSGTARLMGAIIDMFKISFGVMIGVEISKIFFGEFNVLIGTKVPEFLIIPATVITAIAFNIIFRAQKRDTKWILLIGITAVASVYFTSLYLNKFLAVFLAGLIVGTVGNTFARLKNRPAMILVLPGIIFLVPGSIGFKSLSFLFQDEFVKGIGSGFHMMALATTIVAGLFFANLVVNPRRSL